MCTRDVKQLRRRPQVKWSDEIGKVAGVSWMTKALDRNIGKFRGDLHPALD